MMSITQLLGILWASRRMILSIFFGTLLAVMGITLLLPREYVAHVAVMIDSKSADLVTGVALPPQLVAAYMATQVDIISSHNVALKVVDKLKLTESAVVQKKFNSATGGTGSIRDWAADLLLTGLDVEPSRESSVVTINFSGADPSYAATVANAFADSFIITSLELRNDPARRQSTWFDGQIQNLRKNLEESQQHLTQFQRENNLVSIDPGRLDVENARLAEIANQLTAAQSSKLDSTSRLTQLQQMKGQDRLMQMPDILGNPLLQSMKADLVRAEGKLAEVAERYDRNHPLYVGAAAEVNTLRSKLSAEIATARGSIEQTANLADRRESELQSALDQQRQNILELQKQRDQQVVLSHEVENAQRTYDAALQRSSQVRMESELTQSSIAVLNPALPPLKPTKPHYLLNFILAIMAGLLFGVATALLKELADRRIRGREDIEDGLSLPVLGELPSISAKSKNLRRGKGGLVPA